MYGRHWATRFHGCCSGNSWRGNCFQLRIGKFWVLFVLCIQSILHRFAFGGDKLLLKNAYVIPNAAVQLACKIERNAEFKHFFYCTRIEMFTFQLLKWKTHCIKASNCIKCSYNISEGCTWKVLQAFGITCIFQQQFVPSKSKPMQNRLYA